MSCCTYHNGNCFDIEEACCQWCPEHAGQETTWRKVSCTEADAIRQAADHVSASKTDLGGEYGEPEVYSEWWREEDGAVLREHRWPAYPSAIPSIPAGEDRRPCEHYAPVR